MSIHIEAKLGEIAETVLLPGDPLRAKWIAEKFLENPVQYNDVRGMLGFTGMYKGKRVSVQGSGMGVPSISIYAHELINSYQVKKLIRVGSAGSYQESVKIRDIVLAMSACTNSSINKPTFNQEDYAPTAHFELFMNAVDVARKRIFLLKQVPFLPVMFFIMTALNTIKNGPSTGYYVLKWKLQHCIP